MEDDLSGKKRKKNENVNDLEKIKKSKNRISSLDSNMGKMPSNKDKLNTIEIDINELTDILNNNKRTLRTRTSYSTCSNKKKSDSDKDIKKQKINDKKEEKKEEKKVEPKKIDEQEKKKMIKKYGGYFDENDEFIVGDDSIEDSADLEYSSDEEARKAMDEFIDGKRER